MRTSRNHIYTTVLFLISSILLSGCGITFGGNSEGDLNELNRKIKEVVPLCNLEPLEIPNAPVDLESKQWEVLRALASPRLVDSNLIYARDSQGNIDEDKPATAEKYENKSEDKFFYCNSLGKSLDDIDYYTDVDGENLPDNFYCWIPNPSLAKKNLKTLEACEKRLDEISKLGFWIAIRQGQSKEEILSSVLPLAETAATYKYSDYPLAFHKNFAITFEGNFDSVNLASIQNIDSTWKRLTKLLDADLASKYVPKYPLKFQQDSKEDFVSSRTAGRADLNLGYTKSLSALSCESKLVASEVKYSVGKCGKMKFEVFQADLNTGRCTFLGYWIDENENRKIGVVNFCDRYEPGGFSEGSEYEIKVKIDGSTSYTTRMGFENEVLSFSAV